MTAARVQIVVSGVGGQGVLTVARLLAEGAMERGLPVLMSETHGMAQRGGVVVSHLKVGGFEGPLVRAGSADGIVVLKEENLPLHRPFLGEGGWAVVNAAAPPPGAAGDPRTHVVDADGAARGDGNLQGSNLVLLGFALARLSPPEAGGLLFCAAGDVRAVLERRLSGKPQLLSASLRALEQGLRLGAR